MKGASEVVYQSLHAIIFLGTDRNISMTLLAPNESGTILDWKALAEVGLISREMNTDVLFQLLIAKMTSFCLILDLMQ